MKLVIKMNCNNEAFQGQEIFEEVPRILRDLADDISMGYTEKQLYDINGNPVGKMRIGGGNVDF